MQDAAYGAVEASSPPTPPKRFGRKTVVALAALGLAGVAVLRLHVSQLLPPVADWRGYGKVPGAMRGQPHHLSLRQAVLPVRPGLDRRKPQQRRHPALKSGSLSRSSLIAPPPRRPDCVHNTYVSFLRARRIDRGGPG